MSASLADRAKCFCLRAIACLSLWTIVSGLSFPDFAVGLLAATSAAWASVRLAPCAALHSSLRGWVRLILRVPPQSLVAGADVAWRAFDPALPLNPGYVPYFTSLPEGTAQDVFATLAALQPGSLPVRSGARGVLNIHCLDVRLPVVVTLEQEEARLRKALGLEPAGG
jgi:multicomponent Na+:H+ antiporter subunit E